MSTGTIDVRRRFGAEVAIDQHQSAVVEFANEECVGVADSRQDAAERVLLLGWVQSASCAGLAEAHRLGRGEVL